jgi:hypothetical protein
MISARTKKIKSVNLFNAIIVILNIGMYLCKAQEQKSAMGELKLEGGHIERLVLRGKDGKSKWFDKPGETIELHAGQYQLQESRLDGGYVCVQGAGIKNKWITIAENKPAVLEVGAPLKQTIKVKRRGKALVLDYKLLGIGGESYTNEIHNKPPSFIVYKGDDEIISGRFQYG